MHRILALGAAALLLCEAASVAAQPSALKELYGKGVHAFNAGSFEDAASLLSEAIDAGSKDPRCRYFRGLSRLRLGQEDLANEDFAAGAALEVADTDRFYAVSKSLARTQGGERVLLERHRTKARLAAYKRAQELRVLKERGIQDAAAQVELQPARDPATPPAVTPEKTAPQKAEPADEPDPMEEIKDAAEPEEAMEEEDAEESAEEDDQEGDDAADEKEETAEGADENAAKKDDEADAEEGDESDSDEADSEEADAEDADADTEDADTEDADTEDADTEDADTEDADKAASE